MINVIVWLVMGAVVGWLPSPVMKTDNQQGILLNVVAGIEGAVLAGWLVSPLVGAGTIHQAYFSPASLVVSLAGAVIVLAVVNSFRLGAVRRRCRPGASAALPCSTTANGRASLVEKAT